MFNRTRCHHRGVSQFDLIESLANKRTSEKQKTKILEDTFGDPEICLFTDRPHFVAGIEGSISTLNAFKILESDDINLSDEEINLFGTFFSASESRIETFIKLLKVRGINALGYGSFTQNRVQIWGNNFGRLFINSNSREFLIKSLPLLFVLASRKAGVKVGSVTREISGDQGTSQMLNIIAKTLHNPRLLSEDFLVFAHSENAIVRQLVAKNPRCPEHAKVVVALMGE